ncbi:MAG TPA: hypothetical protein VL943_13175 [Niabella sp.]|nr:hypothetical protein [Niabella sp.]
MRSVLKESSLQIKKHRHLLPVSSTNILFLIKDAVVMAGAEAVVDVEATEDDAWLHHNAFWQALYDTGYALHSNALICGDVLHISFSLHVPGNEVDDADAVALAVAAAKRHRY